MANDIVVRVSVEDLTPEALAEITDRLDGVSRAGERAGVSLEQLSRRLGGASSTLGQLVGISSNIEIRQISLQQATDRLNAAQQNYVQTLAEVGAGSERAADAARQLQAARANLEKAELRGNVAMVASGAQLATLVGQAPAAIRSFQGIAAAAGAAAVGMSAFQIAVTGGLAAVGIAGGMVIAKQAFDGFTLSVADSTSALDALEMKHQRLMDTISKGLSVRGAAELAAASLAQVIDDLQGKDPHFEAWAQDVGRFGLKVEAASRQLEFLTQRQATLAGMVQDITPQPVSPAQQLVQETDQLVASWNLWIAKANEVKAAMLDMNEVGVNLEAFSPAFRAQVHEMAKEFSLAGKGEDEFNKAALRSSKALREQREIVAHKDETTEAFNQRLRDLGFTEEEIAARVDETGRRLRSQEEATRRAKEATVELTAAHSLANAGSGGLFHAAGARVSLGGANRQPEPTAGSVEEAQLLFQRAAHLGASGAARNALSIIENASSGARFHERTLAIARGELIAAAQGRRFDTPGFVQATNEGSAGLRDLERFVISAQGGFHGFLGRDQLFLAHAGERVDIDRPNRQPGGVVVQGDIVVHVQGGASPEDTGRAIGRAISAEIVLLNRRRV